MQYYVIRNFKKKNKKNLNNIIIPQIIHSGYYKIIYTRLAARFRVKPTRLMLIIATRIALWTTIYNNDLYKAGTCSKIIIIALKTEPKSAAGLTRKHNVCNMIKCVYNYCTYVRTFYIYIYQVCCGNVWKLTENVPLYTYTNTHVGKRLTIVRWWVSRGWRCRKSRVASPNRFLRGKTFNRRPRANNKSRKSHKRPRPMSISAARKIRCCTGSGDGVQARGASPRPEIMSLPPRARRRRSPVAIILMAAVKIESRWGSRAFNTPPPPAVRPWRTEGLK